MRIATATPAAPAAANLDDVLGELETAVVQTVEQLLADAFQSVAPPAPPSLTAPEIQSTGSLSVKDGVITTPGGFRVIPHGSAAWEIEDPNGHCTDISGDPHVSVDEQHVFDFKRETSFILPDGTRIACQTAPAGNGMTLSSGLTIMNGAQQVKVTDLTGAPQIGQVTPLEGRIDAFAADEDVLRYGLSQQHAGWNLVRDESGQGRHGLVTGDQGGEALVTSGGEIGYRPEEGERGPCWNEPGFPHPENPGPPPPTKPRGPTPENPGPPPAKKVGAVAGDEAQLFQAELGQLEQQLSDLLSRQLKRVIVG